MMQFSHQFGIEVLLNTANCGEVFFQFSSPSWFHMLSDRVLVSCRGSRQIIGQKCSGVRVVPHGAQRSPGQANGQPTRQPAL
jgi:hypothetical protein